MLNINFKNGMSDKQHKLNKQVTFWSKHNKVYRCKSVIPIKGHLKLRKK